MGAYSDSVAWLFSHANYEHKTADAYEAGKFNLERMRVLLERLGNPHLRFKAVHIAGTKGKGSTAAISESLLRAAGFSTGLYTSPHLNTFRERIRVSGEMIPRDTVVKGVARLREIQPGIPGLTVFEMMTGLAFSYFAEAGVEWAVVEVGLGGRLDSTNVLTPQVSVITSISYDHMRILGNTLGEIAGEKAGIIKPGVPVVSSPQGDEAREVIESVAKERGAPLTLVGREWRWEPVRTGVEGQVFNAFYEQSRGPVLGWYALDLPLLGPHQLRNAITALAAIQVITPMDGWLTPDVVRRGLAQVQWPGRFEIVERDPWIILDGAHNRDSAHQLVATLDSILPNVPVHWIFGTLSDKDAPGILDELSRRSPEMIIIRPDHPRSADPQVLAEQARAAGASPVLAETMQQALDLARMQARRDARSPTPVHPSGALLTEAQAAASGGGAIVVTGSIAFVGQARALVRRAQGLPVETDDSA